MKYKKMADGGDPGLDDEQGDALTQFLINAFTKGRDTLGKLPSVMDKAGDVLAGGSPVNAAPLTASHETKTPVKPVAMKTSDNGPDADERTISSHPGLTADDLKGSTEAIEGEEKEAEKYGPDKQSQVLNTLIGKENSVGSNIAKGGAAFADALMQGVARAGNPGFLSGIEESERARNELIAKHGESLQKQNLELIGKKEELEEMKPGSPMHKMVVAPMIPFLMKTYGMDQKAATEFAEKSSPKSLLGLAGPNAEMYRAQMDEELKKATLEYQRMMGMATIKNQQEERQQGAAKALADRGVLKSAIDLIPGTAGHKAAGVLEREATMNPEDEGAVNYLQSIKAKVTPGNIQWAKTKLRK